MMRRNHLVTSAILGILAGAACGGIQQPAASPSASTQPSGGKDGCGNHPPGQCAAAESAKAAPTTSDPAGPLAIARTETVPPGGHVEINLTFVEAAPAKATFKASSPVGWNVHSHPRGEMLVHQKGSGTSGEITFQPPAPGTYSFLWTNDGTAPVTLDVKVTGEQGIREHQR